MNKSYGNLLVCKIIKLRDDKEGFEWRCCEWVNNVAPRSHRLLYEDNISGNIYENISAR